MVLLLAPRLKYYEHVWCVQMYLQGKEKSLLAGGEETLTIHHQLQWLVVPIPDCDPTVLHSRSRKVYEL